MIIDRIKQFIDYKGLSVRKFSQETGLSNGFMSKVKDVGCSKAEKIVDTYPELNLYWLITGQGRMLVKSNKENMQNENSRYDFKPIPLLKVEVIGGFTNEAFSIREEDVEAYYLIPEFKHRDIEFMMRVRGTSMSPCYNSGDIVACSVIRSRNFIQWNKIHVVATREQGILLKRIGQSTNNDTLLMISDNDKYETFEIPKSEITGLAIVEGGVKLE